MKKYILDLKVVSVERVHERYVLIRLTDDNPLPEMLPGQFVEVRVDGSPTTFLRRPISINFVDKDNNELWLLVACVGDGTRRLAMLQPGDTLNCVLPLGNGFSPLSTIHPPPQSGTSTCLSATVCNSFLLAWYPRTSRSRQSVPISNLPTTSLPAD